MEERDEERVLNSISTLFMTKNARVLQNNWHICYFADLSVLEVFCFRNIHLQVSFRNIHLQIFIYKYCNCSVPSQLREQIHAKSPSVMDLFLLNLRFLTASAVNAYACWIVTKNLTIDFPKITLISCFFPVEILMKFLILPLNTYNVTNVTLHIYYI